MRTNAEFGTKTFVETRLMKMEEAKRMNFINNWYKVISSIFLVLFITGCLTADKHSPLIPQNQLPSNISLKLKYQLDCLYSKHPKTRVEAIQSIKEMGKTESALPVLISLLGDWNVAYFDDYITTPTNEIVALIEDEGALATDALKNGLKSSDKEVRLWSLILIRRIGNPGHGQFLISMLKDNDSEVRDNVKVLLCKYTGEDFGYDVPRWRAYWKKPDKGSFFKAYQHKYLGESLFEKKKYGEALNQFESTVNILKKNGREQTTAYIEVLCLAANCMIKADKLDKVRVNLSEAIEISEKMEKPRLLVNALVLMGSYLHTQENYEKSLHYYQKAKVILEESKEDNHNNKVLVYQSMSNVYMDSKDLKNSTKFFIKAFNIIRKGSGNKSLKVSYHKRLANSMKIVKRFNEAIKYYKVALSIANSIQDYQSSADICGELSDTFMMSGDLQQAERYKEQALVLSKRH